MGMYQLSDGTSVETHTEALSPYQDMLKRQLDRTHVILVDPRNPMLLKELLHESMLGRVVLSLGTERFLWAKFQSRLAWYLSGKINPKRGRKKLTKREKQKRRTLRIQRKDAGE